MVALPAAVMAQKQRSYIYPAAELQADLKFLHQVLKSNHPSLYWYTTQEKLDSTFEEAIRSLPDTMHETRFKNVVSKIVATVRCGHTVVRFSKQYQKEREADSISFFPFDVRVWRDTMVVNGSKRSGNFAIQKGTRITAINGKSVPDILQELYQYMSCDGYSIGVNEIRLTYSFPSYYRNIFGDTALFRINYSNDSGPIEEQVVAAYIKAVSLDSAVIAATKKNFRQNKEKLSKAAKEKRLQGIRSLTQDTATNTAIVKVASFSKGFKLKKFYRDAFRTIHKNANEHIIIDIRNNGGGYLSNYIKLAEYLKKQPFHVADSITAISRKLPKGKYLTSAKLNRLIMFFTSPEKKDGLYHFRWFEKQEYKPRKQNHFNGDIYILTSGNTFSAATLFTANLKEQDNCTIIGEETGGGAYGNNGMLIPTLTLPHTKLRVSLPLYKMVINRDAPFTGRGILPDLEVLPTISSIRDEVDLKLERALALIRARSGHQ